MTTSMPSQSPRRKVIVGVDTHKHVHVAVAIDTWGVRLEDRTLSADSGGYRQLISWAEAHGQIEAFGIEGTASYGAGLTSAVRRVGHRVVEVNRGDRRSRRSNDKSDTLDAETAARSVLAGVSHAIPKLADGHAEMIRQVKIARDTAVKARTTAMITLKAVVVNAPAGLREALDALAGDKTLIRLLRPVPAWSYRHHDRVCEAHPARVGEAVVDGTSRVGGGAGSVGPDHRRIIRSALRGIAVATSSSEAALEAFQSSAGQR